MRGSFRERAKQAQNKLAEAHQKSYDRKDDKGFASDNVFDEKILKELGIEIWNPQKGDHLIDVVPFITGKQHPEIAEGAVWYNVDYWAHQRIGDLNRFFVCQRTYKQVDPICTYIQKHRPDKKEWLQIKPTRRCAYLIWCHDNEKEKAKGVQVWDVAHFFFESKVCAIQKDPKTGKNIIWSDFEKGRHVFFNISVSGSFEDAAGKKRDSMEYGGFQLVERDDPVLPDYILDQSFALDEAMKMHPTDKEVTLAFYGDEDNSKPKQIENKEQEQKEEPAKSALERAKERIAKKRQESGEPEPEPEKEPETEYEPEIPHVDLEPDPEPEPEPETKSKIKSKSNEIVCPQVEIGGEFGITIEQMSECDDCALWKACSKEYHRLKNEPKTKPEHEKQAPPKQEQKRKPRLARRS